MAATQSPEAVGEAGSYTLSVKENEQIFNERIVPELFADVPKQDEPTLICMIAQHGAGKSYMMDRRIKPMLAEGDGFVDLDSDIYKTYHPAYKDLSEANPRQVARLLGPDGQAWMRQAYRYVREHRINVLAQVTAQNPSFDAGNLRSFNDEDFRVRVMALGVSEAMSRQGILNRYNEQVQTQGYGRLVSSEKREASLKGILTLARVVDADHLADSVEVYRRGNDTPVYSNLLEADEWVEPPRMYDAIVHERNRPWSDAEKADFLRVQSRLEAELGTEWQHELDAIQTLAQPLMRQVVSFSALS